MKLMIHKNCSKRQKQIVKNIFSHVERETIMSLKFTILIVNVLSEIIIQVVNQGLTDRAIKTNSCFDNKVNTVNTPGDCLYGDTVIQIINQ